MNIRTVITALVTGLVVVFVRQMHAAPGDLLWSFPIVGLGTSSPAVGTNGTVYFADSTNLYALDADGSEIWAFALTNANTDYTSSAAYYCSSPVIGRDGTIYVGTTDGHMFAINPATGTPKWVFTTVYHNQVLCTPAIGPDETIYFGDGGGVFYALRTDGNYRPGFPISFSSSFLASPAVGIDGTVYELSGMAYDAGLGAMFAVRPDGFFFWTNSAPQDYGAEAQWCSPSVGSDGTIYETATTESPGTLIAFNSDPYLGGATNWICTNSPGQFPATPVIGTNNSIIYLGTGTSPGGSGYTEGADIFFAGDTNGTLLADEQLSYGPGAYNDNYMGGINASAAVANDGTIYVSTSYTQLEDNTYVYGIFYSVPSDLSSINWSNAVLQEYALTINSSPAIGTNGTVYIGSTDSNLYAFEGNTNVGPSTNSAWPMWRKDNRHTACAAPPLTIVNVQFGSTSSFTNMTGFAGAGVYSNDFWNALTFTGREGVSGTTSNLFDVASNTTAFTLSVGSTGADHKVLATNALLNGWFENTDGSDIVLTVSNLSVGTYDFYLYGTGGTNIGSPYNMFNTTFSIASGANNLHSPSSQTTSSNQYDMNAWVEGNQYVVFWAVQVTNGSTPVVIDASSPAAPFVNGIQIIRHN